MNKITIFTPTYNREKLLTKTYQSLVEQTDKRFIWLIVDDGSTDDTENLVKKWIEERVINIKYYKKENGGKHTAYNLAIDKVETEYVLIALDSDDILVEDGVEFLNKELNNIKEEQCGIVCLHSNNKKSIDNTCRKYDIEKLNGKSMKLALENNLFMAESVFLLKTEYIKKYKYPVIEGENFFTEAYIYYQMDKEIIWTDKILKIGTYLDDGLTKNTINLFIKNPNSWMIYNEMRMKNNKSFIKRVKYAIYYIAFALLSKNSIWKGKNNKLMLIILFPVGYLGKLYLLKKGIKK